AVPRRGAGSRRACAAAPLQREPSGRTAADAVYDRNCKSFGWLARRSLCEGFRDQAHRVLLRFVGVCRQPLLEHGSQLVDGRGLGRKAPAVAEEVLLPGAVGIRLELPRLVDAARRANDAFDIAATDSTRVVEYG